MQFPSLRKKLIEIVLTDDDMLVHLISVINFFERLLNQLIERIHFISCLIAGLMPLPIFVDVTLRFFFNRPMRGILEVEEFMLVLLVFFAIAYIQKNKQHIIIDVFVSRLSKESQLIIDTFNYLLSFILITMMSYQTILYALRKLTVTSGALKIPVSFFVLLASFGIFLLGVVLFLHLLRYILDIVKHGKSPWLILVLFFGLLIFFSPLMLKQLRWGISPTALGGVGMCFLFLMMLLRMPIGFAMALTGFLGLSIIHPSLKPPMSVLGMVPYSTASSFILIVAPLFILMGELVFISGISKDLFATASKWFSRLPGGVAMSAIAGCAGFAAVCGDSLATAATMATVALPEMRNRKYSLKLATGCLAAGGTLGILIPPSVGFIFYAIVTEESVGKLFIAGILPGLLLATLFCLAIYLIVKIDPDAAPIGEKTTLMEKIIGLKNIWAVLFLFIFVLGGILAGIFSPTEAGAVGAMGAFGFTLLRIRITWQNLRVAMQETVNITCKLLTILIGVGIMSNFLAIVRLPNTLAELVANLEVNRYVIFFAVVIIYIILGCLMNVIPMVLLTLPSIYPTINALGFDPIWFGVVTVILMEMGQITPPVGVNVFTISSIASDVPMETIFRGIFPFFICMIICIGILVIFPEIALFLPKLFFR